MQATHSQIKNIVYDDLEIQPYIFAKDLSYNQICDLFKIRSRMVKIKRNFPNQYKQDLLCVFGCKEEETQEHLLNCEPIIDVLEDKNALAECEYSDLFENTKEQLQTVKVFSEILRIRNKLLEP